MKYAVSNPVRKMNASDVKSSIFPYTDNVKNALLLFMKSFEWCAFTSAPVIDRITGEKVFDADNARSDGKYQWYESDIYHLEKYNLKLNDDFIQHVLNRS